MDDFLHNLRSGKLKQQSGGSRPFNDPQYKGGVRRNQMDRRNKPHHENKESTERLNAIKEVLENLERTQKRMAEAYAARTRAEERKARALEILAKNLYKMLNPNAQDVDQLFAEDPAPIQINAEIPPSMEMRSTDDRQNEEIGTDEDSLSVESDYADLEDADAEVTDDEIETDDERADDENEVDSRSRGRLTELDRHTLYTVINQMRESGEGWEKIARHIASQGYPTISGKGSWRGVMVKALFEKMDE